MTKKEFLIQVMIFRYYIDYAGYNTLTCYRINEYLGLTAHKYYRVFISEFLNTIDGIHIKYYDKTNYPTLLRCMLTEAFFEECLQTGKYKEF